MKKTFSFILVVSMISVLFSGITAYAVSPYRISFQYTGGTNENISFHSPDITYQSGRYYANAGELVRITLSTTRSGYGISGLTFLNDFYQPTVIEGSEIVRDFDDPNTFSFIMPEIDLAKLQIQSAPTVYVEGVRYWEAPVGEAIPASLDGSVAAEPYVCTEKTIIGGESPLFYQTTDYLYKFADENNYGVVDLSGTYLTYTPNAAAAGKVITFMVKGTAGGSATNPLTFTVNVGALPESQPDQFSKNIKATYNASVTDTVYNVDVSWGSMEFTYNAAQIGTWNPETHTYDDAKAANWSGETDANKIMVTNHSNTVVTAGLTYAANASYTGITGAFDKSTLNLATAAGTNVSDAPRATAALTLSGELASGTADHTVVGSVTVTLS